MPLTAFRSSCLYLLLGYGNFQMSTVCCQHSLLSKDVDRTHLKVRMAARLLLRMIHFCIQDRLLLALIICIYSSVMYDFIQNEGSSNFDYLTNISVWQQNVVSVLTYGSTYHKTHRAFLKTIWSTLSVNGWWKCLLCEVSIISCAYFTHNNIVEKLVCVCNIDCFMCFNFLEYLFRGFVVIYDRNTPFTPGFQGPIF